MTSPSQILVLGAGELGASILTALSSLAPPQTTISVLLRPTPSPSPQKAALLAQLDSLSIRVIPGDISTLTPSSLSTFFTPYDLIICCLGFSSGPGSQLKITRAVLDAGVKRYIPWQFGVDYDVVGRGSLQPVWDEQLDVRDLLRKEAGETGTEWVVVSTGIFMSFLFGEFFGVVDVGNAVRGPGEKEEVVRALGSWENTVTVTTPEDIGRLTAMIVFDEKAWGEEREEIVYVAGETVSYGRVKDVVEGVLGRMVGGEVWGVEFLKGELERDGADAIDAYRVVFAEGSGVAWEMGKTYNVKRGIKVTNVEAFARGKLLGERE